MFSVLVNWFMRLMIKLTLLICVFLPLWVLIVIPAALLGKGKQANRGLTRTFREISP